MAGIVAAVSCLATATGCQRSLEAGAPDDPASPGATIRVTATAAVADGALGLEPVEPWLAVDPNDPKHLIASAMTTATDGLQAVVYASGDGGRTWTRAERGEGERLFPGGDPMATFGPDGEAYFTTLADDMTVWRSDDGGTRWPQRTRVPGGTYDRQWVAVDLGDGPRRGRVYSAGKVWITVFDNLARDAMAVSYSDDGGRTFRSPRLFLPDPDDEVLNVVSDLQVAGDGDVLVPFLTYFWRGERSRAGRAALVGRYSLARLGDDGRTHAGPYEIAPRYSFGNAHPAGMKGLGGGKLGVDRSAGRFAGRLYLVWPQVIDDRLQVVVARSADGGRTWREPVRVNDGGFDADHSNPTLAVGDDGTVAVTWNDRRDDPSGRCFRLYGTVSTDGGETWHDNVVLGDGRACPGGRWANGGDTQGLVALPDGGFVAAWIRQVDEGLQLWSTAFTVERDRP